MQKWVLVICVIVGCWQGVLQAQVVNFEKQRSSKKQDGFFADVDLHVNFTKNTREVWMAGEKMQLTYRKLPHTFYVISDLSVLQTDGVSSVNDGFIHGRFNRDLDKKQLVIAEAYHQLQYNRVRKVDRRTISGAGGRFKLYRSDSLEAYLGTSVFHEVEIYTGDLGSVDHMRFSSYVYIDYQFSPNTKFHAIAYYQPRLDKLEDYRLSAEAFLKMKISTHLSMKISYSLVFDSEPPDDTIPETFYTLKNALTLNF